MRIIQGCLLALTLCIWGCGSSDSGGSDTVSEDAGLECSESLACGDGLVCVSNQCVLPQCTVDQECNAGLRCVEYRCRFLGEDDQGIESMDATIQTDAGTSIDMGSALIDAEVADVAPQPDARNFEFDLGVEPDADLVDMMLVDDAALESDVAPVDACEVNFDCEANERCLESVCVLRCTEDSAPPCEAGELCDPDNGLCVESQDCVPDCERGFQCEPISGRCIAVEAPEPPCGGCDGDYECDEDLGACVLPDCDEDRFGGNFDAEGAIELVTGVTDGLSLCTPGDWYSIVIPAGQARPQMGIRIMASLTGGTGNLEMALFPEDFAVGQGALLEATTNATPEVLQDNELPAGRYYLRVYSWWAEGDAPEPLSYELQFETDQHGFCQGALDCVGGRVCESRRCVELVEPCNGECQGLEICDEASGECVEECIEDAFGGVHQSRETAVAIQVGVLDDLTLCGGGDDWFELTIEEAGTLNVEVRGEGDPDENDLQLELWGPPMPPNPDPEAPPPEPLARSAFAGELNERVEYRFDAPTSAFIRVFGAGQARYSLETQLGQACRFDWDCCPAGDFDCRVRCDGVAGLCIPQVCGEDFQCGAREVCDAARRSCVPAACDEDQFGGANDSPATAVPLNGDAQLANLATCDEAEDWFSIPLSAGDGIRVGVNFIDDGFATYDLELRLGGVIIHDSITDGDNEYFEHNVDEDGLYLIRVFGALEGRFDLTVETVPGGIDVIVCDELQSCGRDRICQPGNPSRCVAETCLGDGANIQCLDGYACDGQTGQCICANRDQFLESNQASDHAVLVQEGFDAALTICHGEDDWFRIERAGLDAPQLNFDTDDALGLQVDIIDLEFNPIASQRIFGRDRILLGAGDADVLVVVSGFGAPRPLAYSMSLTSN